MTTAKATAKKPTAKKVTAINSITAQAAGALTVTVQTRLPCAKTIKSCAPLATAMLATGEDTSAELLARLPKTTIAFKCFAQNATNTAQLFAWFSSNQESLTRTTKEGKILLDMAGAYVSAFNITHNKARDGALKEYPFYKRFSNALQQWAKKYNKTIGKRASGAISDTIGAYLDKKLSDNAAALSDSLTAWVLKNEDILQRILDSKAV